MSKPINVRKTKYQGNIKRGLKELSTIYILPGFKPRGCGLILK